MIGLENHGALEGRISPENNSALYVGWNNSGPVRESKALASVIQQLKKELLSVLKMKTASDKYWKRFTGDQEHLEGNF